MARPRTTTYMALLMALGLTAGAVMGVGDAQARITGSTTMYNTVLQTRSDGLKSDCLVPGGNQVVLLGAIGSGDSVSAEFTLETREPVACQMVRQAPEGLPVRTDVAFELVEGEGNLGENHLLALGADSKAVVTLTITAEEEIHQAGHADVQIFCGSLSGTFRIDLIPDPPEETEPEETEPEETEPEETEPEDPTEPTESGEGSKVEVILPGHLDIPTNMAQLSLETLSEVEMTGLLPVKAAVSGLADVVRIGLEDGDPLYPMTRYSLDGGESWYLLYEDGYIELDYETDGEEEAQWLLLLDLSRMELQEDSLLRLEAVAFLGEETAGVCHAETVPRAEPERSDAVQILRGPNPEEQKQLMLLPEGIVPEPAEPGVTEGAAFRIPLPIGWAEATGLRYQAEMLGVLEDGTIGYTGIDWNAQGLNAVLDAETGELVVYLGEATPNAGTYRLTLESEFEGLCFYREQTTFFINYSTRSDVQNEEVPDNE